MIKAGKFYAVCDVEKDGKCFATIYPFTSADNIARKFDFARSVCVLPTKKAANELMKYWNDNYHQRGIYYWD